MACGQRKQWYIESHFGVFNLTTNTAGQYIWSDKRIGLKPKLYDNLRTARKVADKQHGVVRFYDPKDAYDVADIPF